VRVSCIEAIPVAYPEPNDCNAERQLCLVRVQGDDGQVGWGESITQFAEASVATKAIIEGMSPLLIGKDPVHTDSLWRSLKQHSWWYGNNSGIACFAVAALDIALWDLKGKALGVSVLDLLGGPVRERLPAIASAHAFKPSIEEMAYDAAGWIGRGLHGVKVGFGKQGDAHLGYEHDRDIAFVKALRDAIGPDPEIMIDLGVKVYWDVSTAIRRVRAMEEFDLAWIEEPLGPTDPAGYGVLRDAVSTKIAYGEREWNLDGYQRILDSGTVDVVGVDPGRAEGITGFRQIAQRVEVARRQANAHAWSSAIISAASLAISFSSLACRLFEVKPLRNPMQHDLVATPIEPVEGWMRPLSGPGLGIEVLGDVVDHYRLDPGA
jgi:L-alanine-DL-glutamate epimerase-like enolase superfamily enzyme